MGRPRLLPQRCRTGWTTASTSRQILDRCRKRTTARAAARSATAANKRAGEMRAKMQEMKARGDIAGMMQMAQQFQREGRGDAAAAHGKQEMDRDL